MSSHSADHKARVRQEFTQQAQAYALMPAITNRDRLVRLVQAVHPQPGAQVLDVATGPGYIAATFAEAGCEVIGLDLTEAPLALAEQMRQARGLENLSFQSGDAEQLPFSEQSFDIVVCRYALHHCEDPRLVLTEMARACRTQGLVVVEDLVTSEHPERAAYQNRFERLRDTSHVRALPISEFLALLTECQLEVEQIYTDQLTPAVETWLANAQTSEERAREVRLLIEEDESRDLSGTHPFREQGELAFHQRTAAFIARKGASLQV